MIMSKLLRLAKRQHHTIVSRDIIKPSSPTPNQLKTYNLSLLDQCAPNSYMPIVAFYPSSKIYQSSVDKTSELKNSLSQTLTQYYPFAGRLKQYGPKCVDCNDYGVEFIEACNDSSLSDFLQHSKHKDFDQLFPNDLIWYNPKLKGDKDENNITCPLGVQVNHFACGGMAVATSLSHKIGDGVTTLNFINHWATVTKQSRSRDKNDTSLINPNVIHWQTRNINFPELLSCKSCVGCVTRSFLFPNQKLNDLKAKVTAMTVESGKPIMNPTRVEVLTWLLHKCAVAATTRANPGTFKATGMAFPIDMRNIMVEKLPGTTIGNIVCMLEFPTSNQSEFAPDITIGELRKRKSQFQSMINLEVATSILAEMSFETVLETSKRIDESYIYSSLCRFPTYRIDFGWGKPVKVTVGGGIKNFTVLLDTPNDDGIEAIVCFEKEVMNTFQQDPELLAFC
ncbi:deacetylvindoline O-acetyltransferase [Artemisia annua]|uniref:Deacetylvindoline O-acetyltransferase n=1 Tax=Artemisia annua TaxID=35608 RepID=A0A2U1Q5M5_ARTAN|nr:deacetylvindoline O-acetyltransferase [Artemisia annua]